MKNIFFKSGLLAACNLVFTSQFVSAATKAEPKETVKTKPNVLMIIVDDWGPSDLSSMGSKFYETPNIDTLSSYSTNFQQAYVAYPRSVPSRYAMMTGLNCARPQKDVKGTEADERKVDKKSYAIAEPFKAAGYNTYFIGKWHLATDDCMPQDKGFDINIGGGHAGATSSHFAPFNQNYKPNQTTGEGGMIENMDDAAPGEYLTDYMSRKVVSYIEKEHKEPFFAVCSFYAVHTPIQAKKDIIAKYRAKKERLGLMEDTYIPEEAGERKAVQNNEVYAAMIESVDEGVGTMVKALKRTGQFDNTIILIISDHGGLSNRGAGNKRELATCNDPYKAGKGHLYEGGIRVPFIVHMPGQTKKISSDIPVVSYDIFPTVTDLCQVPLKKDALLDGKSLKAVVTNGKVDKTLKTRELFWHKAAERPTQTGDYVSSAVRKGNFKLIDFYTQNRVELYDVVNDPGEKNNLAQAKPDMVKALMGDIAQWRKDLNVNMPSDKKGANKAGARKGAGKKAGNGKADKAAQED